MSQQQSKMGVYWQWHRNTYIQRGWWYNLPQHTTVKHKPIKTRTSGNFLNLILKTPLNNVILHIINLLKQLFAWVQWSNWAGEICSLSPTGPLKQWRTRELQGVQIPYLISAKMRSATVWGSFLWISKHYIRYGKGVSMMKTMVKSTEKTGNTLLSGPFSNSFSFILI